MVTNRDLKHLLCSEAILHKLHVLVNGTWEVSFPKVVETNQQRNERNNSVG